MADTTPPVEQASALLRSMNVKDLRYMRDFTRQCLNKFCRFLDELPTELRLWIYELVLVEPDGGLEYDIWGANHDTTTMQELINIDSRWSQPALLLTCKRIRAEAMPVYLEGNTFLVECYAYNPTALIRFSSFARNATKRHRAVCVLIELDGVSLRNQDWDNIWKWLRLYHDGELPYRPRRGFDLVEGGQFDAPDFYRVISALFDMLDTLKRARCPWEVVRNVLEDAVDGADAVTDWTV